MFLVRIFAAIATAMKSLYTAFSFAIGVAALVAGVRTALRS
jgi:ascorbate-specific PTS system EIIC-type component UlaA